MNQVTLRPHQTKTVKAMLYHKKGQVIVPTGGGKTMCMISDAINEFTRTNISQTIVVVAPRILLAQQLCEEFLEQIKNVDVLHVHSGETHHTSTTKVDKIREFNYQTACNNGNLLIFTTYHSLHKIQESNIVVDTVYFDEAHNSTAKNFFPSVEHYSKDCLLYTSDAADEP